MNAQNQNEMVKCEIAGKEVGKSQCIGFKRDDDKEYYVSVEALTMLATSDDVWSTVRNHRQSLEDNARGRMQGQQEGSKAMVDELAKISLELAETLERQPTFPEIQAKLEENMKAADNTKEVVSNTVTDNKDTEEGSESNVE